MVNIFQNLEKLMSTGNEMESLVSRVLALEKVNRRLQFSFLVACLLSVFLILFSYRATSGACRVYAQPDGSVIRDTVRARAFEVVDGSGRVLARLAQDFDRAGLVIFDDGGVPLAEFATVRHGGSAENVDPRFALNDSSGHSVLIATVSNNAPTLLFRDKKEKNRIRMGVHQQERPKLEVLVTCPHFMYHLL